MRTRYFAIYLAILLIPALTGCFIFSPDHLNSLSDSGAGDAGPRSDAGTIALDDTCGAASPRYLLTQTTRDIRIDTTTLNNALISTCGGAPSQGNDAFIAVDTPAGTYWHFHLRNDPTDPMSVARRPGLYMLPEACDPRDCRFNSDVCDENGAEHFGFVPDTTGVWYLAIDDASTGGGRYLLDAIRPTCGDGRRDHGEPCERGDANCTNDCVFRITTGQAEQEPNDNPTEANFLDFQAADTIEVQGDIGGPGACRYADSFQLDVPPGARVQVDVLRSDGAVCDDRTLTDAFRLVLTDATFHSVSPTMTDPTTGCATIRSPILTGGGIHFVEVVLPAELSLSVPYRLRVRIVPA